MSFEWLAASGNPVSQWAPNGRPNFSAAPADPSMVPSVYVPGTGATYTENWGPVPVPEPSFAWGLLVGVGALGGLPEIPSPGPNGAQRRGRAEGRDRLRRPRVSGPLGDRDSPGAGPAPTR